MSFICINGDPLKSLTSHSNADRFSQHLFILLERVAMDGPHMLHAQTAYKKRLLCTKSLNSLGTIDEHVFVSLEIHFNRLSSLVKIV